jgi:hypothetical protein
MRRCLPWESISPPADAAASLVASARHRLAAGMQALRAPAGHADQMTRLLADRLMILDFQTGADMENFPYRR